MTKCMEKKAHQKSALSVSACDVSSISEGIAEVVDDLACILLLVF